MNQAHFHIADLTLAVACPLPFEEIGLPGRLSPFGIPPPAHPSNIVIHWEGVRHLSPLPANERIYDPKHVWRMFKGRDGYETLVDIDYASRWNTRPPRARLEVNNTWEKALLLERMVTRNQQFSTILPVGPSELMIRTRIIFNGGLVFHACGLDDNGRGLLMAGRAGAGKSTQGLLWAREDGVVALSDDRVAVRLNTDGVTIYGTPWGGTANIARSHQVPLSAILLLEKARENELVPLSPAESVPLLAARAFLPYWNSELLARAFDVLDRLLAQIPVYRLRCSPEPAVIPLVRSVL